MELIDLKNWIDFEEANAGHNFKDFCQEYPPDRMLIHVSQPPPAHQFSRQVVVTFSNFGRRRVALVWSSHETSKQSQWSTQLGLKPGHLEPESSAQGIRRPRAGLSWKFFVRSAFVYKLSCVNLYRETEMIESERQCFIGNIISKRNSSPRPESS